MLKCQKDLFYLDNNVHYLNNAYMSPNMKSVEIAGIVGLRSKSKPYLVQPSDFFSPLERLKATFAKVINCSEPYRIAVIPSASYGLANVAKNIDCTNKKNIIIPTEQFPSNFYVWEKLARENNLEIKMIAPPDERKNRGAEWNERVIRSIDQDTALVACGHIHWADGTKFDLKAIRNACDRSGAYLVVDGSQSIGALPFDIEEIKPDALITVGYKWLFGPYGIGFAYMNERFDEGDPIEENWKNRVNSDDFKSLVNYQSEYRPLASRYDVGESSKFIDVPMMQTALDQILAWGVEDIQAYSKNLIDPYLRALEDIGCTIEDENFRCQHLLGVRLPERMDMSLIAERLKARNIYVSMRGSAIRVATSVYNSKRDLDQFYASMLNSQEV